MTSFGVNKTFDEECEAIFAVEGVGQPAGDPGGETVLGVARRFHPPERGALERALWARVDKLRASGYENRNIGTDATVRAAAKAIYLSSYWYAYRCHEMQPPIAVMVFDGVLNQPATDTGPDEGIIEMLQEALRIPVTGILDDATVSAAAKQRTNADMEAVLIDFAGSRCRRYAKKSNPAWHEGLFIREHKAFLRAVKKMWNVK